MNKKFPGNPYTLDAKSTLAVEYINTAQKKVDRYLSCGDDGSAKEKQANYEAALNLEKAIALVREDDADFASSLRNRMYFLKANGDFGKDGANGDINTAFQNAYAALSIDRNGAYIQNKLAQLHLQNPRILKNQMIKTIKQKSQYEKAVLDIHWVEVSPKATLLILATHKPDMSALPLIQQ